MPAPNSNSAYDKTAVYDRDGGSYTVTKLNALDLTRSGKFFWNPPTETIEEEADPVDPVAAPEPVEPIQTTVAPEPVEPAADVADAEALHIEDEAKLVAGDDVSPHDYLKGFSPDALRSKLEKDFGFKARRNATKETMIEKYLELDAEQE